jgi:ribonuclease HI
MNSQPSAKLFTDGSCIGNPGPGGWGVLLKIGFEEKELSGFDPQTTNNRMELFAVIRGVETLPQGMHLTISTDSRYVKDGMTQWIHRWQKNGWRTTAKEPVKNVDLWTRLVEVLKTHEVSWVWIKGHDGHPENERADRLAQKAARQGMASEKPNSY